MSNTEYINYLKSRKKKVSKTKIINELRKKLKENRQNEDVNNEIIEVKIKNRRKLKDINIVGIPDNMLSKYQSYSDRSLKKFNGEPIDPKLFLQLLNGECVYCGSNEYQTIDRIDSKIGYIETNMQTCCKFCNFMKYQFTEKFFLSQISKIYNYGRSKENTKES